MLSRRSIRIKVMQLLFTINRDEDLQFRELKTRYWQSIDETYHLYLFGIYSMIEITKQAVEDERKRKSKHLPSDYDKTFEAVLYKNPTIQSLVTNRELQDVFANKGFDKKGNEDYFIKIYQEFSKTDEYQSYISGKQSEKDTENILLDLYRFCRQHELYNEMMEDQYMNWTDDKSVVVGTIKKVIKDLPNEDNSFYKNHYPDQATIKDFGEKLLVDTYQGDAELLETIEPILTNWDSDRVAILDMIIIKMAISELLDFSTIPTKVTLNEYVDIAKSYSTDKSKDFVNGILDRILKEMEESGKIEKEGRGLLN